MPEDASKEPAAQAPAAVPVRALLTEDEVKQGVKECLEAAGFRVTVAWGRERGIDIAAVSGAEALPLEAKAAP
jgi:hypothetical protein